MKNWKKTILLVMLFLFATANCIETFQYFFQNEISITTLDLQADDKEEKDAESEKSSKEGKFNTEKLLNYWTPWKSESLTSNFLPIPFLQNLSTSDYSQVIFSPPEILCS